MGRAKSDPAQPNRSFDKKAAPLVQCAHDERGRGNSGDNRLKRTEGGESSVPIRQEDGLGARSPKSQ